MGCQKPSVQHAALRSGGFPWHVRNLLVVLQLSGREASNGTSETCSACSSQAGRFPTSCQKPPRCSPALRPGGFPWHVRNLLFFSMQLSGWKASHDTSETSMARQKPPCCSPSLRPGGFPWHVGNLLFFSMQLSVQEVSHVMAETSLLFPSPQAGRLPRARQKPSVPQHAALRPGGFPHHGRNLLVVPQPSDQEASHGTSETSLLFPSSQVRRNVWSESRLGGGRWTLLYPPPSPPT